MSRSRGRTVPGSKQVNGSVARQNIRSGQTPNLLARCPQPMSTDSPIGTESKRMDCRLVWCESLESEMPDKMSS
ncbi:hypothetical protein AVEN_92865-1 [Araneus ventricosus]|uniref:Uncharacterized protein n=1 Tax=Araneus ventricosus TaxID=182803 RepID=A0A4Y2NRL1_ARAVE|nr:hypothetical protein AVEN_92865-1 [Araneus ventricosus]